jgi:hypothetical protein
MERQGFIKSFIVPLVIVVGIMVVSGIIYHSASGLEPGKLRDSLINIFGRLLFFSIWFFALVGPPLAYFRGALFIERLIIAFANPVIWIVRMESMVACQFSGIEMIYFLFLPWFFGIICVTLFLFSISEIVCRTIHKIKDPEDVRVFHPAVVVLLVLGLAGTYMGLIKGQEWVYMVVHHYAAHFLN